VSVSRSWDPIPSALDVVETLDQSRTAQRGEIYFQPGYVDQENQEMCG
jgi:hypothetical protein